MHQCTANIMPNANAGNVQSQNRLMRRAWLTLRQHTTLAQRLYVEYAEKQVEFQRHVMKLRKHVYMPDHIGNTGQNPVFFYKPWNVIGKEKRCQKRSCWLAWSLCARKRADDQ
jgi:hypothetical protein